MIPGVEIPGPVFVLGLITGCTYGLLAVGLVLVHRSNRIVNFAHGEIGVLGATLLGLAVVRWHLPYWVAFLPALVVAAGVGAGAEVVVVRRLRKAPPLMSVVATLGLGQFLFLLSSAIGSQVQSGLMFPEPVGLPTLTVGTLRITPAYMAMLVFTSPLVLGLAVFLKRSRLGLAIRGAADNPEAARLGGVPVARMSSLSWALAGAVSAFTAILVSPTRGFTTAASLGPALLLRALVPAVVARMSNLPVAFGVGIAVGVVEQTLTWNWPRGRIVEAVLFACVLAVLLLQPRKGTREKEPSRWTAIQAWDPLPERLAALRAVRRLRAGLVGGALAVAVALPLLVTNATSIVLVAIMSFAIVGLSVGVVTGLGGQLSLGQFALAGIGAAVSVRIVAATGSFPLGFAGAVAAAALASVVIGLPALRISGLMLTVSTLAFALATQFWLLRQPWMIGDHREPGRPIVGSLVLDTGRSYYFVALVSLLLALVVTHHVRRGALGRCLVAVRDNEDAARAMTVRAVAVKLQGFALGGALAGLGGAVYAHSLSSIDPSAFSVSASVDVVAMTVIGGLGTLVGPLAGAFYVIGVPRFLPLDAAGLAATSLGWLLFVLYVPAGLPQLVLPLRRRVLDAIARRAGQGDRATADDPGAAGGDAQVAAVVQPLGRLLPRPEPPAGPLLEVREVTKRYGGLQAVGGVSLSLDPGETLGLIGPNGAGKTTLFELVGGFVPADGGQVRFGARDVTRLTPEARARLGLVRSFQDAALFPTLTVLDTVKLALERAVPARFVPEVLGLRRAERRRDARARQLITAMGLDRFRERRVAELSTGTRRICELACIVALEPTVLLLDEPSSGVAQRETEALGGLLRRLRDSLDVSMIVIEHDMPLVMGLSDRVLAMESGRELACGTPQEIRTHPLVLASYLGDDATAIERSGSAM